MNITATHVLGGVAAGAVGYILLSKFHPSALTRGHAQAELGPAIDTAKSPNFLKTIGIAGCAAGLAATGLGPAGAPLCMAGGELAPTIFKGIGKGGKAVGKGVGKGAVAVGKGTAKGVKKVGKLFGLGDIDVDTELAGYALGASRRRVINRPARMSGGLVRRALQLGDGDLTAYAGGCCGTSDCDC